MSRFENSLFVRLRVVAELAAADDPSTVRLQFERLVGVSFLQVHREGQALSFCALLDGSDPGAVASLDGLLVAARHSGSLSGVRELIVEVGREADLPLDFVRHLRRPPDERAPDDDPLTTEATKRSRLQCCAAGLLVALSLLSMQPRLAKAGDAAQRSPGELSGASLRIAHQGALVRAGVLRLMRR